MGAKIVSSIKSIIHGQISINKSIANSFSDHFIGNIQSSMLFFICGHFLFAKLK